MIDAPRERRPGAEGERLIVTAESGGVGKAREDVEALREGDDVEIAFNAKYLLDVLSVLESEGVRFELTGASSPGLLRAAHASDAIFGHDDVLGTRFEVNSIAEGPHGPVTIVNGDDPTWGRLFQVDSLSDGLRATMRTAPKPLDVVEPRRDLPEHRLRRARLGAIGDLRPPNQRKVDFVAPDGRTDAILALRAGAFAIVRSESAVAA